MKFYCLKEDFQNLIKSLTKVSSKNSISEIYNNCFFHIKNNFLVSTVQNIEAGIGVSVNIPITADFEIKFYSFIDNFKGIFSNLENKNIEKISFEIQDKFLIIKYEETKIHIPISQENIDEHFVEISKPQKNILSYLNLMSDAFINAVRSVEYASFKKGFREDLSSVFLYNQGNELFFVSTDTLILAEKKIGLDRASGKIENDLEILLPVSNIRSIINILDNYKEKKVSISLYDDQIVFEISNILIVSKLINASFPDYKQIIPKKFNTKIFVLKDDIQEIIKLSNSIKNGEDEKISFKIEKGIVNVNYASNSSSFYKKFQASSEGASLEIHFNYKYLENVLRFISSESLIFEIVDEKSPVIIRGNSESDYLFLMATIID